MWNELLESLFDNSRYDFDSQRHLIQQNKNGEFMGEPTYLINGQTITESQVREHVEKTGYLN